MSFKSYSDRRDRDRDRDRDRERSTSYRSEPLRPSNPSRRSSYADERRDRDRPDPSIPRRPDAAPSSLSHSSPIRASHASSPPKSPLERTRKQNTPSSTEQSTISNSNAHEITKILDILGERNESHRNYHEAQKKLNKMKAKLEKLGSVHPEFISEHQIWRFEQSEAERQKVKSASKLRQCDQDAQKACLAFLETHQKPGLTPTAFDAKAKAWEITLDKKLDEMVNERIKKINEEWEAERVDLNLRLEQQVTKNQSLEAQMKALGERVDQLATQPPEPVAPPVQVKELTEDPIFNEVKAKVTAQESRLKELETAWQEHLTKQDVQASELNHVREDLEAQKQASAGAPPADTIAQLHQRVEDVEQEVVSLKRKQEAPEEPPVSEIPATSSTNSPSIGQLEIKVATFQGMFVNTIGDVKSLEKQLSKQETAVQDLTEKLKHVQDKLSQNERMSDGARLQSRSATPNQPTERNQREESHSRVSSEDNSVVPSSLETKLQGVIDKKLNNLIDRLGLLIDKERKLRAETEDSYKKLFNDLTASFNEVSKTVNSQADVTSDAIAKFKTQQDVIDAMQKAIDAQQQSTETSKKNFTEISGRLEAKIQSDQKVIEDLAGRIQYLCLWKDNFNTTELSKQMVAHISHAIPQGMQAQLSTLRERLKSIESIVHNSGSEFFKKRKAENGNAVAVNGH